MPLLEVWKSKNAIISKRGQGRGYSGVENPLFFEDNSRMLYGDAKESVDALSKQIARVRGGTAVSPPASTPQFGSIASGTAVSAFPLRPHSAVLHPLSASNERRSCNAFRASRSSPGAITDAPER